MALIAAHLNAGHSGGDSVAIGIYSPSSPPPPYPLPPFSVSVDVKHHVYLPLFVSFGVSPESRLNIGCSIDWPNIRLLTAIGPDPIHFRH